MWLLKENAVHLRAIDVHDTKHRPPVLSEEREFVAKRFDLDLAGTLVEDNPAAIVAGKHCLPSLRLSFNQERSPPARWVDDTPRGRPSHLTLTASEDAGTKCVSDRASSETFSPLALAFPLLLSRQFPMRLAQLGKVTMLLK